MEAAILPLFSFPGGGAGGGGPSAIDAPSVRRCVAIRSRAKVALITRVLWIDDGEPPSVLYSGFGMAAGRKPRPASIGENRFGRSDRRTVEPQIDVPVGAASIMSPGHLR